MVTHQHPRGWGCPPQAYFHGGLDANSVTAPINGSTVEMVDLRDFSTYVLQMQSNETLEVSCAGGGLAGWCVHVCVAGGGGGGSQA
jgi:hypothetical protein